MTTVDPADRGASFDYCFNYFQSYREQDRIEALINDENLQLSCLQLGFYLASWGMYRGSSHLLQKSVRYLAPVVEAIVHAPAAIWSIDTNEYSDDNCQLILDVGEQMQSATKGHRATVTLATKTMLGTFGCVPAFDRYFRRGLGLSTFNLVSLRAIGKHYADNAQTIEARRVSMRTIDFETGNLTNRIFPRAKVIDLDLVEQGQR
jgi:hypothetical protein